MESSGTGLELRWDRSFQDKKIKVCLRESMEHAPVLQQPPKDGARVEMNPPTTLQVTCCTVQ